MRKALLVTAALAAVFAFGATATADAIGSCDPLDPAVCLQPWPNDYFTTADSTTDTGRRLNLDIASMPRNQAGKPIDPTDFNRNDGFSPGQEIVTHVAGLDNPAAFAQTGAVPITDVARTYDADQPAVVLTADTLQRQLIWSELDQNPDDHPEDPANVNLIIRPAVNFDEGGHYIVALRRLKDAAGNTIPAQEPFRIYRDNIPTSAPAEIQPSMSGCSDHASQCAMNAPASRLTMYAHAAPCQGRPITASRRLVMPAPTRNTPADQS